MVNSGRHQWLGRATSEIQFVLTNIENCERQREELVREAGGELGLGDSPSLESLADECTEPWSSTFLDHRKAIRALLGRVLQVAQGNREVLSKYVLAVNDALSIVGRATGDYSGPSYLPDGSMVGASRDVRLLDVKS